MSDMDRWFRRVRREFGPLVSRFKGKPALYVEIGCYAGASAHYVAENVLDHPDSRGVGIDPYLFYDGKRTPAEIEAIEAHARQRLETYEKQGKWRWIHEPSHDALRLLDERIGFVPLPAIDCLYIDGSHYAHDVTIDFALAWRWLAPGALVIFDDFGVGMRKPERHVPEAVEAIRLAWGDLIRQVHFGPRQVAFEVKRKSLVQ